MNKILEAIADADDPLAERVVLAGDYPRSPLPLSAHYRREVDYERRRQEFYMQMARYYGFENWWLSGSGRPRPFESDSGKGGRDGRGLDLVASRQSVLVFDKNAAPFEWLIFGDWLEDETMCNTIASIRTTAGLMFRADMEKSQLSALRSPDLGSTPGGLGGSKPLTVSKMEAWDSIARMRNDMDPEGFDLLERVVWKDEWLFRRSDKVRKGKAKAYVLTKVEETLIVQLTRALDKAGVHYGLLPYSDYSEKWVEVTEQNEPLQGS